MNMKDVLNLPNPKLVSVFPMEEDGDVSSPIAPKELEVVYTVVLMEAVRDVSYLFARSFLSGEITTVQLMAVGDAVKAWVVPRVLNQPLTFV